MIDQISEPFVSYFLAACSGPLHAANQTNFIQKCKFSAPDWGSHCSTPHVI